MKCPLVWMVVWVDDIGRGHGSCGHRHASADEATMCPFEPEGAPLTSAGLVREVRDPNYVTLGHALAAAYPTHVAQLELAL